MENLVVLQLDAKYGTAPTVGMTLTTAAAKTTNESLRRSIEQVTKAIRRRWPKAEYLGFVEWTTGDGAKSGGVRRIHVHFLLKGLTGDDCAEAERVARTVWKSRTKAHRVEVRELRSVGGATAYLAPHHQKTAQAPPPGWSGKRFRPSRGYFGRPLDELRAQARHLIAERRALRIAEHELEREFLAAGAATEEVEVVELEDGGARLHTTVTIAAGDLWDEWMVERYEHELRRLGMSQPILCRARHRDVVDETTGEIRRELVEVYEPVASAAAARMAA